MREIYTAHLEQKALLSAAAQCYHFKFVFQAEAPPMLEAGQFLSLLAEDQAGKTYTRAYSIASSPPLQGPLAFDLCVNRVAGGFFSNLLCDMQEGEAIRCHGPHGLFMLKQPLADSLLIAAGTGIAPMRGFAQWLFPEAAADRSAGREYWLVYESAHPKEFFYDRYFQELEARCASFHYVPVLGTDGQHGQMEREIGRIVEGTRGQSSPTAASSMVTDQFDKHAYVCGLSEMVKAARAQLGELGWQKRQIIFERFD